MQYFGKRYYAPALNRWVSADPLAIHVPGKADFNLYAYVRGRSLQAIDVVGLDDTAPFEVFETQEAYDEWEAAATSSQDGVGPVASPTVLALPQDTIVARHPTFREGGPMQNKQRFTSVVAQDNAARGNLDLAGVAELRHGCAYCHIVKNGWANDVEIGHYMAVARGMNALSETATTGVVFGTFGGLQAPSLSLSTARSFYTVQSSDDAARLIVGAGEWPTSSTRAALGEGIYAWI